MSTVSPPHESAIPHLSTGAAKETLEDYTLRFAPRSYRRWGTLSETTAVAAARSISSGARGQGQVRGVRLWAGRVGSSSGSSGGFPWAGRCPSRGCRTTASRVVPTTRE